MANSGKYPASGKTAESGRSGVPGNSGDTTGNEGYPPGGWGDSIFGGPLPMGTGAPGSQGGTGNGLDPTNEIGQTQDGFTGISEDEITHTGAPGTQGAVDGSGGTAISYTAPNDGIVTYTTDTVNDDLSGPRDSTQANDQGYATGGPQLPGLAGNEPQAGSGRYQPGGGHVLRGGRAVRP